MYFDTVMLEEIKKPSLELLIMAFYRTFFGFLLKNLHELHH